MERQLLALVVEDDQEWADLLDLLLAKAGYAVLRAASAATALEYAGHARVDLAVLDLALPDLTGDVLLERLRALPGKKRLPAMFLSSSHPDEANLSGPETFLPKDAGIGPILSTFRTFAAAGRAP